MSILSRFIRSGGIESRLPLLILLLSTLQAHEFEENRCHITSDISSGQIVFYFSYFLAVDGNRLASQRLPGLYPSFRIAG